MSDATDAWEAWQHAKRALNTAMPWTADWLRLRIVEQDRRASYIALFDADPNDTAGPLTSAQPGQGKLPSR